MSTSAPAATLATSHAFDTREKELARLNASDVQVGCVRDKFFPAFADAIAGKTLTNVQIADAFRAAVRTAGIPKPNLVYQRADRILPCLMENRDQITSIAAMLNKS